MCRPSANTENSHRTREKPLVPRVPIWWYFIQLYCTCKFLYKPLIRHQRGKNYFCPSWCKKIFPRLTKPRHFLFNPFCPWKSSIKMRLKLVERFSGHCLAKTYHKTVTRVINFVAFWSRCKNINLRSSAMHRKQNFEIGFKSAHSSIDLYFSLSLLSSPLLSLFLP